MTESIVIGRVIKANIFPFKGMRGLEMEEITLKSISVVGDRRFAFTMTESPEVPTFLDTIKFPGLLRYSPSFVDPLNPKSSEVMILTPEGKRYGADSAELIEEISQATGKKLAVVQMGRGAYHSMPVSLLSRSSVKPIEDNIGVMIDDRRFRQNLIIETVLGLPFEEDTWMGKELQFGDREGGARIMVIKPDKRCATINLDPETGEHTSVFLKSVVRLHNNTLGVYCTIIKEGIIRVGDEITLPTHQV